jgi:hypothetical protein
VPPHPCISQVPFIRWKVTALQRSQRCQGPRVVIKIRFAGSRHSPACCRCSSRMPASISQSQSLSRVAMAVVSEVGSPSLNPSACRMIQPRALRLTGRTEGDVNECHCLKRFPPVFSGHFVMLRAGGSSWCRRLAGP